MKAEAPLSWRSKFTHWLLRGWVPAGRPAQGDPILVDMFGGRQATSGAQVSESTAVSWTALAAGIRFLAETLASLPIHVYELDGRSRRKLPRGSPLVRLLTDQPNPEITPFEFFELLQIHIVLWGNGYAQIVLDQAGRPIELWPLNPDRVQLDRDAAGKVMYRVSYPGTEPGSLAGSAILRDDEMLHIRGFSRWGLLGERMTKLYREAIGLGLATEEFGARFIGQGLSPSGILVHPGQLSEEAAERLRKSIANQTQGLDRAHRLLILEEGMTWTQTAIDPQKSQFIETRKFQIGEACRILRLPPHVLYDLERATFSNIEHQGIELVTYTMLPWAVRWEQRLEKHLVSVKMRNTQFIKFNMGGLLRGDTQSRYAAYATAHQNGWLSVNDIRELEDLNPVEDGDTYLEPLNMQPIGTPRPAPAANAEDAP